MATIDFGKVLRSAARARPSAMPEILACAAFALGASDVVVYLVDFGQSVLEPLPDHLAHAEVPTSEPVVGTMAGRAFVDHAVETAQRDGHLRVWVPILEGSDTTGVIALSLAGAQEADLDALADLGLLAGN